MPQVDHGFKSRKLWLIIASQVLIAVGGLICAKLPALIPIFPTYCTTMVTLCGLYAAGNITEKHVLGKQEISTK